MASTFEERVGVIRERLRGTPNMTTFDLLAQRNGEELARLWTIKMADSFPEAWAETLAMVKALADDPNAFDERVAFPLYRFAAKAMAGKIKKPGSRPPKHGRRDLAVALAVHYAVTTWGVPATSNRKRRRGKGHPSLPDADIGSACDVVLAAAKAEKLDAGITYSTVEKIWHRWKDSDAIEMLTRPGGLPDPVEAVPEAGPGEDVGETVSRLVAAYEARPSEETTG